MERVQFQQEQMLAELKDLVEKNLFTAEIEGNKNDHEARTEFETALVRRVAKKGDFIRYAAYEMSLEQCAEAGRAIECVESGPATVSDYALRFKGDVAQREGARALVGRITARAIQMHPGEARGMGAARTLLQRELVLWREYVKMEVGFVESVRRRWEVLGIADEDEDEGRKEIMEGAIVKTVMESAVQAVPQMELFVALKEVVSDAVKDHFYKLLRATLGHDARAAKMLAERLVHAGMTEPSCVGDGSREEMGRAYVEFVRSWCERDIDGDLKAYLVGSLKAAARQKKAVPVLMAGHVSMLTGKEATKAGREYCRREAGSAEVWVARLTAERRFGTASSAAAVLAEARAHVPGQELLQESVGQGAQGVCECDARGWSGTTECRTDIGSGQAHGSLLSSPASLLGRVVTAALEACAMFVGGEGGTEEAHSTTMDILAG
ncbi:hypothetical protein BD779DRAFT_1503746 [Infundibulicybe gibba]|nr:hypothetical protein BD779DRAFT_1503746 [Infundibulicybe gibba]